MKPQEQTYSKSRRLKNQIKAVVTNPYNIIVLIAVVLLVYLIVLPLLDMIATTFELAQRDIRAVGGGKAGDFTLYYWQRLLASELSWTMLIKPLINSLVIGVCVSVCAILLGSILAWLMVRSDLPFKKFFSLAVIIPYMIPSWCKSQAWLSMFKTARLGGAPGFMASLGLDVPEWLAYGPVAIIIVLTLHYYAYTYLLVSSALNSINSELEEMGEIQGAGKAMILRKITLPLVLPAILSAVILTFSKAIGTFGTINYLGSPVQYYTLSSQLYMNINSRDTQTGFAMAILMIIIASIAVFVNQKLIGSRKSYATIGGKGGRSTLIGLGKVGRPVITAALVVFFAVGIIMPIVILVMESFMLKEGIYSLDNFTLHYWIGESNPQIMEGLPGIFKNDEFINSLFNSLRLTLVNGVFGTIFGQLLGYITAKGRGRLHGKLVEQLVFIPYLIPSVAFGGIYLSMFSQPQQIFGVTLVPALYGTFALLTLVSVKHLPFAARAGTSNMLQISGELEEAATIEGAGFFRRFVKIVFPLSKGGFISGFMLIFVSIMKELDLIILIMTPTTSTLPYLAFRYQNGNSPQASDCVAIVMFSIVFLVYAIANLSGKADLAKSMAG